MLKSRLGDFLSTRGFYFASGLVTLITAILYISTATTRLTNANYGSDGGDLLAAVLTLGIPHPTGYPTYILIGKLFQLIPLGTPVFRATLESLLPMALAAGLLTAWMGHVMASRSIQTLAGATLTGLTWGMAPLVFSQAVIVEIHGLQSLIVVIVLWWITLILDFLRGQNKKWMLGLAFLAGLGFGNHITLILFIPAVVLAWIMVLRESGQWRLVLALVGLLITGLLVYLYLPLRAHAYPAINWGNPQSWSGFLWEVTGNPYRGFLFSARIPEILERLRSVSSLLWEQFGALGLVAGAIGVIQYSFRTKWHRWILAWIFFAFLMFAILYHTTDSVGYLIPAMMMFAIWIGLAVPAMWSLSWGKIPIGLLLTAILAISILIRVPATRDRVDPRTQDQPARYAEQLLQNAPYQSIVYTTTDQDSFPLWYYHFGLRHRPDLRVIVLPLTQFVWYQQTIVHIYSDLKFPNIYTQDQPNADWGLQIAQLNPGRAVCYTHISAETETGVAYQCSTP